VCVCVRALEIQYSICINVWEVAIKFHVLLILVLNTKWWLTSLCGYITLRGRADLGMRYIKEAGFDPEHVMIH
jgi:hypothetical protein